MSDSSDDEDISRFKEVVDTSFIKLINESQSQLQENSNNKNFSQEKLKSNRYLEEASHYNDIKVPEQMQKRIWSKVSAIIQKNIIFVDSDLGSGYNLTESGNKFFFLEILNRIQKSGIILNGWKKVHAKKKAEKHKIKGGVKLFQSSDGFLSCTEVKDTYTENHNMQSKRNNQMKKRKIVDDDENINEDDKITAAAMSGEYILSKEETKCWKSRRKPKVFKYKGKKKSNVLTLVD